MSVVRNAFVLMLCMNLFLYFYLPSDLNTGQENLLSKFIDISDSGDVSLSQNMTSNLPSSKSEDSASIGGSNINFIDTFSMIWGFLYFIISLLFAPILVALIIPDVPTAVVLLFIVPNVLLVVFGLVSFIKGSDL